MKPYKVWLILLLLISAVQFSCKKDLYEATVSGDANSIVLTGSASAGGAIALSVATDSAVVLRLNWTDPGYFKDTAKGNVIIRYILDLDTAASFTTAKSYTIGDAVRADSLTGLNLNNKLLAIGCTPGKATAVYTRIRSVFEGDTLASNTVSFTVTPYALPLPALLVMGYGGWTTPSVRTDGYLLTSVNKDNKYEGYINFSYASWGGANCRLLSTADNSAYGWGTDAYTLQKGDDIAGLGNLWITPCPNYMKVNVDLSALTIDYTPIRFLMSGTYNNWGNTAMTFDASTNLWTASDISFAAGDSFAFISSVWNAGTSAWDAPSWNISYKVDDEGNLIYGGAPDWKGNNITVAEAGTYTVTLDLSKGDGSYTYSMTKN